jgi:hypothetical protein
MAEKDPTLRVNMGIKLCIQWTLHEKQNAVKGIGVTDFWLSLAKG